MPQAKTKPEPLRRNSQYQKRLSSILKAAAKVIARDGFEGASVREVAVKAKIGLSGIYYYFKNKDELLYAIQDHTFSTLVVLLKKRLSHANSPEAKLKGVIDNHINFFVNNINDLKVCVHEIESLSGSNYKNVLKIRQEYFELVKEVVDANLPNNAKLDPALVSLYLFGSLNWIYMWYDPEKNRDTVQLSDHLMKIFTRGINAT